MTSVDTHNEAASTGSLGDMIATDVCTLDATASCLAYPHPESANHARKAAAGWSANYPQVASAFIKLAEWLDETDKLVIEEAYTNLFDLKPACTLDIGHHVFGEAYQRGALLAGLIGEHREYGVDLNDELPDYLPTVLRLLGRLPNTPERALFMKRIIGVAVGRMKKELIRIDTPWAHAVSSLADVYIAPAEELDDSLHKRIRLEVLNRA